MLLQIHNAFVPVILVAGAATLLCGVVLLFTRQVRAGSVPPLGQRIFRILLTLTAALGALQALWGVLLVTQGFRPRDQLHFVYGLIVLLAIPVAFAYSDQKQVRRDILIMTIAAVAIIGAAFRAVATGH